VAAGTAAAQAIAFAFSPLITRIYSPEVFGIQGVFLSWVGILSPVIALRYPMAIITAETEDEASRLVRLSLLIASVVACLLLLVLVAGSQSVLTLLGAEEMGQLVLFLPLALFCVALQDVADFRAARLGAFRAVGIVEVAQAFLTNLVRVLGGIVAPIAAVLVAVTSFAPAVKAAMLQYCARGGENHESGFCLYEFRDLLHRYRDFPLYRMPTDLLNAASQAVPVILLAVYFSPAAAGQYALTRSVLNLPFNIIGVAVGNVLYARFAELARDGKPLSPLLFQSTLALLSVAPVIIGLAWFAPAVFSFVFGENWREAGQYAQWMALWIGIALANVPSVRLAPVIRAQKSLLMANVTILIARAFSIFAVVGIGEDAGYAVATVSVVGAAANLLLTIHLFVMCRRHEILTDLTFRPS